MKSIKTYLSIGIAAMLLFSSCDDYLDVNENPNSPENAPVEMHIGPLIAGLTFNMQDSWPAILSSNWSQQISNNGDPYYYNVDWYQMGQPWFGFSDTWDASYTTIAKNARAAYQRAEEDESLKNHEGVAKLIFVWNMSILTDLYGDIPYSEAFNPADPTPPYDAQENIYPELFTLLDDAISALEEGGPVPLGANDLLYGGDMDKWVRLAYSLKARLLMRLTEAPDGQKQQRASDALDALANGLQSNADNAVFSYIDDNDSRNPWNRFRADEASEHVQLSANYIEMLQDLDDPRLSIHAEEAAEHDPGEEYVGHANGAEGMAIDSVSHIGSYFTDPGAPSTLMDYAEVKFLEAQALLITQGPAAANSAYEEAIRADMEDLGVADADITTYIAAREDLSVSGNPLEDIIEQKYIANFLTPEPWNDWRKTGYPQLQAAQNPNGESPNFDEIPRRWPWPGSELDNNSEEVEKTGLPMNFEVMLETVWWDTR
jgi:hypothetical protein